VGHQRGKKRKLGRNDRVLTKSREASRRGGRKETRCWVGTRKNFLTRAKKKKIKPGGQPRFNPKIRKGGTRKGGDLHEKGAGGVQEKKKRNCKFHGVGEGSGGVKKV